MHTLVRTTFAEFTPDNWTQGTSARDANGNGVPPYSPNAVRWCMIGWMDHVGTAQEVYWAMYRAVKIKYGSPHISHVNDNATSFEDVKALIEAAAEIHDDGKLFPS